MIASSIPNQPRVTKIIQGNFGQNKENIICCLNSDGSIVSIFLVLWKKDHFFAPASGKFNHYRCFLWFTQVAGIEFQLQTT